MDYKTFLGKLNLENKALSVKRTDEGKAEKYVSGGCNFISIKKALDGERVLFSEDTLTCPGAPEGFGFSDEAVFDKENTSVGTKFKSSPEVAYEQKLNRPTNVLEGKKNIEIYPYDGEEADVVSFLANPDQLAALIALYTYRHSSYDTVITPFSSICGSVMRLPFGELSKEQPRAVVGMIDSARSNFEKDELFFTVPYEAFQTMLTDADSLYATEFLWSKLFSRINEAS